MTKKRYPFSAFVLILIYAATRISKVNVVGYSYWIALLRLLLFLLVIFILPKLYVPGRRISHKRVAFSAAVGALIFIGIKFILGAGLAQIKLSPYNLEPEGIFSTIVTTVPMALARESVRAYAIAASAKKKWLKIFFLMMTTIALADLVVPNFGENKQLEDVLTYIAQYTVPALATSVLLTMLVYYGGSISGIAYTLVYELFIHCFPYLPDLTWIAESAVGIIFPIIFSLTVLENGQITRGTRRVREERVTAGYVLSLGFVILFSWFCVGVFPIYPSVILTGSMLPKIHPGDVILIQKPKDQSEIENLQIGDVINFDQENIVITHRIIEVKKDNAGNFSFITKGDNNSVEDEDIVEPGEINGRYIVVVPKIGIPMMLFRSRGEIPEGVVN